MTAVRSPALVTAVYPGVERFLRQWYDSVERSAHNAALWIALDALSPGDVTKAIGREPRANWVPCAPGSGIGAVRQAVIDAAIAHHDAVIFIDCDDELLPGRVERSVEHLASADVVASHMRLIDERSCPMGARFQPARVDIDTMVIRGNAFGLSNSAYRAETLRRIPPIPGACRIVDWYLITVAWSQGARLAIDPHDGTNYRQHGSNMTSVLPPFSREQIVAASASVEGHFDEVIPAVEDATAREQLAAAQMRARRFADALKNGAIDDRYLDALNALPAPHPWWLLVAHPQLEDMWNRS